MKLKKYILGIMTGIFCVSCLACAGQDTGKTPTVTPEPTKEAEHTMTPVPTETPTPVPNYSKVKVDGNWYVVDATWGDVSMGISYKSGSYWNSSTYTDYYEMGMHNYFLVTDAFIKDNHKEDSDVYPKTAPIPYNHYAKRTMQSGENVVDMYVNETGEELKTKLDVIADAIVADVKAKNRVQEFSVGGTTKQSYYFFYELGYSPLAKSNVLKYMTSSSSFAKKLKNQNYGFSLFEMDGAVGIIVSYHYGNRLPSSSLQIG